MKRNIIIYTKSYCPFCIELKNFLNDSHVSFTEEEISDRPEVHQEIIERTGHDTVPAIFVDDKFVGGSEEFYEWFSRNS